MLYQLRNDSTASSTLFFLSAHKVQSIGGRRNDRHDQSPKQDGGDRAIKDKVENGPWTGSHDNAEAADHCTEQSNPLHHNSGSSGP